MFNVIKRKVSRIGRDDLASSSSSLTLNAPPPPLPSPSQFHQSFLPMQTNPPPVPRKNKRRNRPKSPSLPPRPPKEPEFTLDTNLDEMDGIVDMTIRHHDAQRLVMANENASASSPGSGFESSYQSSSLSASDNSFHPLAPSPPPFGNGSANGFLFSNPYPFLSNAGVGGANIVSGSAFAAANGAATHRRRGASHLDRRISPRTLLPKPPALDASKYASASLPNVPTNADDEPHSPGWAAPESWAVEREAVYADAVPDYTDSDGSDSLESSPPLLPDRAQTIRQQRRRARNARRAQSIPTYQIRIHRNDGTYHVVKCPLTTTVAELVPIMNHKLFLDETREPHSLYVKERERGESWL